MSSTGFKFKKWEQEKKQKVEELEQITKKQNRWLKAEEARPRKVRRIRKGEGRIAQQKHEEAWLEMREEVWREATTIW